MLDRMRKREQALERILAVQTTLLTQQASRHTTDSEDLRASVLRTREDMRTARADLLGLRFEWISHLSAQEWQAVFAAP